MSRRHNPRLAKLSRNYTVEDVAKLYDVHKNAVRNWLRTGLTAIDDRRPALVTGRALRAFLEQRRSLTLRPCRPGQAYCLKCRVPRFTAGLVAEYHPLSDRHGNLVGLCEVCGCRLFRRVTLAKLEADQGNLTVVLKEPPRHIADSSRLSLNRDSESE